MDIFCIQLIINIYVPKFQLYFIFLLRYFALLICNFVTIIINCIQQLIYYNFNQLLD